MPSLLHPTTVREPDLAGVLEATGTWQVSVGGRLPRHSFGGSL